MTNKFLLLCFFMATYVALWAQPAYIPASGLTSFSEFDGSNPFQIYNTTAAYGNDRDGNANSALTWSGVGNLYASNFLANSNTAFTVSVWFKFMGYSSWFTSGNYFPTLVDYRNDGLCSNPGCQPFNLRVVHNASATYLEASINTTNNQSLAAYYTAGSAATSPLNIGQWYHAVVTWDYQVNNLVLYLNGVAVSTVATPNVISLNGVLGGFTRIGAYDGGISQTGFNGSLDELGFWSRALSASEVANIYNEVRGCSAPVITGQAWQANDTITLCSHCDDFGVRCFFGFSVNPEPNVTYEWRNDNGVYISGANLYIANYYGAPAGNYWVTATNACGTVVSDTFYLNYYTPFSSSINEVGNVFTAIASSTNNTYTYTYEWYDGGLNLVGTGNTYTANASGTYYVKIINQFGCSRISSTNFTLGGCTAPTFTGLIGTGDFGGVTITDTLTLCPGYGLEMQANFTGSPTSYAWFYDGVLLNSQTTQNLFLSNVGAGRYWATATNSCGTVSSDTIVVQFTPDYTFTTGQQGNSIQLTINPTPVNANVQVTWSFDDRFLTLAGAGNPFSPSLAATYYPMVEVTYNANYTFNTCYFTPSPVVFSPISCPNPPVVYPLAIDKCDGDSYNFDGQELMTTGTYFATFVDANGCDSIVELTLTMFDAPANPIIVANGDTLSVETTDTVTLDYAWYLNGSLIANETDPSLTAAADGDYTVWVTLGNCITVSAPFTYTDPGVGIKENALANAINVYPNPTKGTLSIANNGQGTLRYQVYNATGTIVATGSASGTTQLDLTNQAAGVYLLHLADTNGNVTTTRFVKE